MEEPFLNLKPGFKQQIADKLSDKVVRFTAIGGVFLFILIVGVIFLWHQKFITTKFTHYAPVDSVYYVDFRNSFWPWQYTALADSLATKFFSDSIISQVLPEATHGALALTPINGVLENVYYFYIKDSATAISLAREYPFAQVVDNRVLIIADSQQSLFKVEEVYQKNIKSLATLVDQNLMGQETLNYYLDSDNIRAYLSRRDDLISKIFTYLSHQDFYISGTKRQDHWRFDFNNNFLDLNSPSGIIENVPEDFSLYLSGVNLNFVISLWQSIDQQLAYDLSQSNDALEKIYNFYDADDVKKLFNQSADLVVFDTSSNFLGFNFVLGLDDFTTDQLLAFEELIKIILAQKLPTQFSYILPDGSRVTELLANTEEWQWQTEDGVRYLSEPRLDFNIGYEIKDNKLFISSAKVLLDRFNDDSGINLIRLTSRCGFSVSNSLGLILNNSSQFSSSLLPDGILALSQKSGTKIGGCVIPQQVASDNPKNQ